MPKVKDVVILADGDFPSHEIPLDILRSAGFIISCDGAAGKLIETGIIPDMIAGDMDSLAPALQERFASIIYRSDCQETNDLTKAFMLALELNPETISILGATGLREDHTLGNISLLCDYSGMTPIPVTMWTNYGKFIFISGGGVFKAPAGSQVSLFALEDGIRMNSRGLKYQLQNVIFDNWWKATLNESVGDQFELIFEKGRVILFIGYL